jgi:hypothetical protein
MVSATLAARPRRTARPGLLAFYLGAGFDLLLGLDLLLFGGPVAELVLPNHPELLGVETATLARGLGLALIVVALDGFLFARSPRLRKLLPAIVALNWSWVAVSAVALLFDSDALSGAGVAIVLVVALLTAALGATQARALGQRAAAAS